MHGSGADTHANVPTCSQRVSHLSRPHTATSDEEKHVRAATGEHVQQLMPMFFLFQHARTNGNTATLV
jgi:hypothetical protein